MNCRCQIISCIALIGWAFAVIAAPQSLPDTATETTITPLAAESIWPSLIKGMRLGGEDRPEVRRFIAHYSANPEYFTAMLARAEPFLWFVLAQAEQRHLPTELVLLPAVESGWNPHAVSVSSAYGLWQFIPKTGDAYGLKDALNYDARRDPIASTTVALDLLAELYGEYHDWPLALAAYNTGGVRVKQAMKTARTRQFWRLPLPPVTKDYVPRLLAIAALVRNPVRYGVTLPHIAESGVAEVITLDQDMPLHLALQAAGVDDEVLRIFNPGLQVSSAPTQSPTLLLPPAEALAVRAELALLWQKSPVATMSVQPSAVAPPSLAPVALRLSERLGSEGLMRTQLDTAQPADYEVQSGDTLFAIAQRHGLSVAQLKRMNPDTGVSSLRVGQTLKLNDCSRPRCG